MICFYHCTETMTQLFFFLFCTVYKKFITCRKLAIMAPAVKTSRNLEDEVGRRLFFFFSCQLNVSIGPGAEGAPLPGRSIHGNQSQRPAAAAAAGAGQHTHSALLLSKQVSTLTRADTWM